MNMTVYGVCSLAVGLIWTGIALLCGASFALAFALFVLAWAFSFFVLAFIGGAGANNQRCDDISAKYFVNKEIE